MNKQILARNKKTGALMTLANKSMLQFLSKEFELVETDYFTEKNNDFTVTIIEPDTEQKLEHNASGQISDTSQITLVEFKDLIDTFNESELQLFAKDKRKTISQTAKQKLKELQ